MHGRSMRKLDAVFGQVVINVNGLSVGVYAVTARTMDGRTHVVKFMKE
jgi:hypothetical protein